MIRRNLGLLLFSSLCCSLFFSVSNVNAAYITEFYDFGDSTAVDMNNYMVNGDVYLSGCVYSDSESSSCFSDSSTQFTRVSGSNEFSGPSFDTSNYKVHFSGFDYNTISSNSNQNDDYIPYAEFSCSSDDIYIGSHVSYSGMSFDEVLRGNIVDSLHPMGLFSSTRLSSSSFNYYSDLPGYSSSLSYNLISSSSSNGSIISIYRLSSNIQDPNYFYLYSWSDSFYLRNYSASSPSFTLNGTVIGCSETSVSNMLLSLDPNPTPTPTPTPSFPYSYDSGDSDNNEYSWDYLNSLDPQDFQVSNQESTDILSFISNLVSSFTDLEENISHCQLYMPAFFGNRFNFGNNGAGNQFLYVNLCDNAFISGLWDSNTWISTISAKSTYGGQSWLYVGYKGFVWLVCFWLMIKLLLGFVYWFYALVDNAFGLNEVGGDLG